MLKQSDIKSVQQLQAIHGHLSDRQTLDGLNNGMEKLFEKKTKNKWLNIMYQPWETLPLPSVDSAGYCVASRLDKCFSVHRTPFTDKSK